MESENMMNQDAQEESKAQEMENTPKAIPQENTMTQGMPGETIKKSDVEKTKMSKKQVIGLVVLSLIALGGVLFGIYGMNSQNDQIANLKVQVSNAENNKAAKLETEDVAIVDSDENTTKIIDGTDGVAIDASEYFYIGEWGLKVKVPEELIITKYRYANDAGNRDNSSLCIMGYSKKDGQEFPDFTNVDDYLTCISRGPNGFSPYGVLILSDNKYDYLFNNAQTYYSKGGDDEELQWEKESRELMSKVFGSQGNYSAINNLGTNGD